MASAGSKINSFASFKRHEAVRAGLTIALPRHRLFSRDFIKESSRDFSRDFSRESSRDLAGNLTHVVYARNSKNVQPGRFG